MNIRHISIIVSVVVMRTALGQTAPSTTEQKVPAINLQVIKSWKLDLGDHSLFLNRVAPPLFPPAPAPAPRVPESVLTLEQRQALERQEARKSVILFMWVTVFDGEVSECNWSDEHGAHRVFSNIDFNYLAGMGGFETPEASYTLMMVVGNETRAERIQVIRSLTPEDVKSGLQLDIPPPATNFSLTHSQYVVAEDKSHRSPDADDLTALDALHAYFDANRQMLIEEHAKREAADAERERWLQEHPPVPKDVTVNFWPGKNTVILDGRTRAAK